MRRHLVPVLLLLVLGFLVQQPRKIGEVGTDLSRATVSPDGRFCVGLRQQEKNRSYAVWEVRTGREVLAWQALSEPPATYNPFAWSPDGATLAVGAGEHVTVWDKDFKRSRRFKVDWMARDVRFSGNVLMVRTDQAALLFDVARGKQVYRQAQQHLLAARLSRNGKYLALASFEEPIVLFDVAEKRVLTTLKAGPATVNLEFCHNDEWLACGFRFRERRESDLALVYDWKTGQRVGDAMNQTGIFGFAVSEDGTRLLVRGPDTTRVWDVPGHRVLCERQLESRLMDAFSADGRLAATVPSGSRVAVIWSAEGGDLHRLPTEGIPTAVAFPGQGLFAVTEGKLSLYGLP